MSPWWSTVIIKVERGCVPLWGILILPVSLMISGMSFVSSIVEEMSSSNCRNYLSMFMSSIGRRAYQRDLDRLGECMGQ